jgi:hypothetical protein
MSMVAYKETLGAVIRSLARSPDTAAQLLEIVRAVPDTLPSSTIEISPEIDRLSTDLLEQLSAHVRFDLGPTTAALLAEAKDYFWVQYRERAAGPWVSAHPAFAVGDAAPESIEISEIFAGAIPEELQHRIRFEVVIEQQLGGSVVETAVIPAWERPAANLVGLPVTYVNQPDGLTIRNLLAEGSFDGALNRTNFFMPAFAGEVPDGARFFGLAGLTAPADVAGTPFAGIFQTIGSTVSRAAGALASLGSTSAPRAAAQLIGQTMRITLIAPGGSEREIERSIWAAESAQPRNEDAIRNALAARFTAMVAVGRYPAPFVMHRLLETLASTKPVVQSLVRMSYASTSEELSAAAEVSGDIEDRLSHLLAFSMFDLGADRLADLSYRPSPTVAMYRESLNAVAETPASFDVLANERRVFGLDENGTGFASAPSDAVRIGVWESLSEQAALPAGTGLTSAAIFAQARDEGIPLRVLSPEDRSALDAVEISDDMRNAILANVDSGYFVVVPERAPRASGRSAWWRVDPQSGNTLGYLDTGIGGATEWLILTGQAVSVIAGVMCGALLANDNNGLTRRDFLRCAALTGAGVASGGVAAVLALNLGVAATVAGGTAFAFNAAMMGMLNLVVGAIDKPGLDRPL